VSWHPVKLACCSLMRIEKAGGGSSVAPWAKQKSAWWCDSPRMSAYTLSLGPMFTYAIVEFAGFSTTLNYGYDKVRFIAPVPVDSRVRMRSRLTGVKRVGGGAQAALQQTFEIDGAVKPACVADSILRFVD